MVARFKPVHSGHRAVLEALLSRAGRVILGLGSSNRYDRDNPFTAAESAAMIRLAVGAEGLDGRLELVEVPDLGNGPRWRAMVVDLLGPLDLFVTANPFVRELMREVYPVVHPGTLVPPASHMAVDGTSVRLALARGGEEWKEWVPGPVAAYLEEQGIARRFRREFGLETLALLAPVVG